LSENRKGSDERQRAYDVFVTGEVRNENVRDYRERGRDWGKGDCKDFGNDGKMRKVAGRRGDGGFKSSLFVCLVLMGRKVKDTRPSE
jgi:hypothetical protein